MAFIDRAGDIIIDAVLTDLGRERLARNDGSFKIVSYTFADDEVDYTLFNPTTGSTFIDSEILNLPIFEANINDKLNLNYPLMTITNPNLKYLPSLAADNTSISIGESKNQFAGVTVRFYQNTNQNSKIVPVEIQDSAFRIETDFDLLYIENQTPVDTTPYGSALYLLQRDDQIIQASQGSQITFKLRVQSLSNIVWDTFGQGTKGTRTISTLVKATGLNSGLSNNITVTINEEFVR